MLKYSQLPISVYVQKVETETAETVKLSRRQVRVEDGDCETVGTVKGSSRQMKVSHDYQVFTDCVFTLVDKPGKIKFMN